MPIMRGQRAITGDPATTTRWPERLLACLLACLLGLQRLGLVHTWPERTGDEETLAGSYNLARIFARGTQILTCAGGFPLSPPNGGASQKKKFQFDPSPQASFTIASPLTLSSF